MTLKRRQNNVLCYQGYSHFFALSCADFYRCVTKEMHKHLLAKESQVLPEHARGWVMREALEQRFIPSYGTFRASLALCVEEKIVPVWRRLLALMDDNDNLMVLHENLEQYQELWVNLFCTFCRAEEHHENPIETIKHMPGHHVMSFPFSRRISLMLDTLIGNHVLIAGRCSNQYFTPNSMWYNQFFFKLFSMSIF